MAVLQNNHAVVSSLFVSKTEGCIKAPVRNLLHCKSNSNSQNEKKKKKGNNHLNKFIFHKLKQNLDCRSFAGKIPT